jgi:hypothetical protein
MYMTTTDARKLKATCINAVRMGINWEKVGIDIDVCKIDVTYKVVNNDFVYTYK